MTTAPASSVHARKDRIVAEAATLIARRGYAAVTVEEIAAAAGVTAAAIYRHFSGKEAVLWAVLDQTIATWIGAAEAAAGDASTGPETLRGMITGGIDLVVDRPAPLASYVRERHRSDAETRRSLSRQEAVLFELWGGAMSSVQPSLTKLDLVIRQQAINGVLGSLASRSNRLAPSRVRRLVGDGLFLVAAAPAARFDALQPAHVLWTAPTTRRRRILVEAMRLFSERGYHGVGMDDIGKAAGMAGPSVYEHFPSKVDILVDAFDHAGSLVMSGVTATLAAAQSAAEALDRLVCSYVEIALTNPDFLTVTTREGASLPALHVPRLSRRRHEFLDVWSAVLCQVRPELGAGDARTLVLSAIAGAEQIGRGRWQGNPPVAPSASLIHTFLVSSSGGGSHG